MATVALSTLVGGAYDSLQALIVRGHLAPARSLVEAEVALRLGVSRTPVREALRRLLHEGLVVQTGGGARPRLAVAPLSKADVEQLYPAAGALEGVAARGIARLSTRDRRDLATRMAKIDRDFKGAYSPQNPDWDTMFGFHDMFHRSLRSASAGPTILSLLESIRPQVDRYEWVFGPLTGPDFSESFREHDAIVREVREGNAARIERAVRANWFKGGARLAAVIDTAEGLKKIGSFWDRA